MQSRFALLVPILAAFMALACGPRGDDEADAQDAAAGLDVSADIRLPEDATGSVDAGAEVTPVDAGGPACVWDHDCPGAEWTCMTPVCHPDLGCLLTPRPDGISCDDGNPCTYGGVCKAGICRFAIPKNCDDANPCTFDWCREGDGKCMHTNTINNSPCLSTDPCVVIATCQKGKCTPKGPKWCDCKKNADCAKFDDGNSCNGVQYCDLDHFPWLCKAKPNSKVVCKPDSDTECAKSTCHPDTGKCYAKKAKEGTACDDGKACTSGETCKDGSCTPEKDSCGG